jgi:hypothetical protein
VRATAVDAHHQKSMNTRLVFLAARRFIWAAASSQHRSSGLHAKAMAGVSEREKVDGQRDSKGNIASPRALLLELHALRTLNRDIGIYWACFYSYPPSFMIIIAQASREMACYTVGEFRKKKQ